MTMALLIESFPIKMELCEGREGRVVARGEFGRCDVPTQNGRIYSKSLVEREIKRLDTEMRRRRLYGELDHPSDGKTKLQRVSHVITDLRVEPDGRVVGEAEILNTPNGQTLKALLEAGCEVGISSRGFGSTKANSNGTEDVQSDFVMRTYDFVYDPASKDAYPQIFAESTDWTEKNEKDIRELYPDLVSLIEQEATEKAKKDIEESLAQAKKDASKIIEDAVKDAVKKRESELKENYERNIVGALVGIKAELSEGIRSELSADPEVAGAKAILGQIASMVSRFTQTPEAEAVEDALTAKDMEISKLKESCDRLSSLAKRASFTLMLERRIAGHPLAKTIRSVVQINENETAEQLNSRLNIVLEDMESVTPTVTSESELKETIASLERVLELKAAELAEWQKNERIAVGAMESAEIKLADRTEELNAYKAKFDEMLERRVEREKASDADAIKCMNEELESLKARLEEANKRLVKAVELGEKLKKALDSSDDKNRELGEETAKLKLEVYKRERIAGLTNGRQVLRLLESADTERDVDNIVSESARTRMSDPQLEEARNKLRRGTETSTMLNEDKSHEGGLGADLLGHSMSDIRRLSGI